MSAVLTEGRFNGKPNNIKRLVILYRFLRFFSNTRALHELPLLGQAKRFFGLVAQMRKTPQTRGVDSP